ncbi:hypothetical protein MNBD_GAMMA26-719 [hydrothermal vent metagenome]|uniref:Flagellar assembly factor FliW n=1 Tax=hydrothermal vent metagenome TaxID=652676 RepID=A0A3B1B696_9ZZZZ
MKINTTAFGQQEIDSETLISFPLGFPGFEDCKQYKLFHQEQHRELYFLQSLEDTDLCFSLMEPTLFGYEYEIRLSNDDLELLKAKEAEDLAILLMVFQSTNTDESYRSSDAPAITHWRSPIVINLKAQIGLQKTLQNITKIEKIIGE